MASLTVFADALKFETLGITMGVAAGGLTELVANEVVDALGINDTNTPFETVNTKLPTQLANMLVRGAVGVVGFIVAERVMRAANIRRDDPTEGVYFSYAFAASQQGLYKATVTMGHIISSGQIFQFGDASAPPAKCCDDCADGKPCAGK